ncbi:MAG: hypothetical protein HRT66_05725 [Flavobacteriaceae bacterium]|nr:hypothetical protein [Flavobacteriaceae bacterium]
MKKEHLKENEIQEYVFDFRNCNYSIIQHIDNCNTCKKAVTDYTLLSEGIKTQPEPLLEYDLAEMVMAKLPAVEKKPKREYNSSGLVALILGIIGATIYLFKNNISTLVKLNDIATYLIISIGAIIAVLWIADIVKSHNKKINSIYLQH